MRLKESRSSLEAPLSGWWRGTERYEVLVSIGAGGMGVVYEAFDRERRQLVALKTVLRYDPSALYLFKREFRTLADVQHRNLVKLHELVVSDDGRVFFTMELVRGLEFLAYVCRPDERAGRDGGGRVARDSSGPADGAVTRRTLSAADPNRLVAAMRQLVAGVSALHDAGKLHRDIKPSNIRVAPDGRVVLLDFGLAAELGRPGGATPAGDGAVVGSPFYMAPEQVGDAAPTAASDWYSVGVVLYEALVGRPPFVGSAMEVIAAKNTLGPPPPSAVVDGVPGELDRLCCSLLQLEPSRRPSAAEIAHILGVIRSAPPAADETSPFVGRAAQLAALRDAFEATRCDRPIMVRVSGASGLGKSTLVHHFLDELTTSGAAVVLRGRTYEREAIPYKAVDALVDALARQLMNMEAEGAELALPADTWLLARLFPVLQGVQSVAALAEQVIEQPQAVRRRAFVAFRELIRFLTARFPLVLFIDDAHWGDGDSANLMLEMLRPPKPPPILLVTTHRDDATAESPFLGELDRSWPEDVEVRPMTLAELDANDAHRLALKLLDRDSPLAERTAHAVARESHGSPFLIEELVRSNRGRAPDAEQTLVLVTLDQMVSERLERLPREARRMLELLSVAARPIPVAVMGAAAGLEEGIQEVVALLGDRRFVRIGLRDGCDVLETRHERVREIVVARLSRWSLREHHRRLAHALGATPGVDGEAVAMHWLGAAEPAKAAEFAESAGERAAAQFAFGQAARLLRMAADNAPASSSSERRLKGRHAELLQLAGRHEESARAYLEVAREAPAEDRVELQRAAAEQLLAAGRIDEGTEVLYRVLAAIGVPAPRSPLLALLRLLYYRVRLALMGLNFEMRDPAKIARADRLRIDAFYTVAVGFGVVNVILSACMQARHLLEALRKGDRFQILRAASLEATLLATAGGRETKREQGLVSLARALAEGHESPEGRQFFEACWGVGLFQRGRWREALELLEGPAKKTRYIRATLTNVNLFAAHAHYFLGDFKENAKRLEHLRLTAMGYGDVATLVNLRTTVAIRHRLAVDDVQGARRAVEEALAGWPTTAFFVQHWQLMVYGPEVDLYAGDGGRAYDRFMSTMPALKRSLLLQSVFIRILTAFARGRFAVASIASRPELRQRRMAEASDMARRLGREHDAWAAVPASLLRALVANEAGDRDATVLHLRHGIARAEATQTLVFAVHARYRLAQTLGGEEGQRLMRSASQTLNDWGVKNHESWVDFHLPGRWYGRGLNHDEDHRPRVGDSKWPRTET